jgi:type III secretory pathway component EscS
VGLSLLSVVGVLMALVGAATMLAPRPLAFALRLLGVRWQPHQASRVAAWGLVGLGLVVVVLTRAVR